jgi:YD repeat-containing protein
MNKKYQRYINFIVNDLQPPYYENMREIYGVSEKEYLLVLSKIFNEPIKIINADTVVNQGGNLIYYEDNTGYWEKKEYDTNDKIIYSEDSNGYWSKSEYDNNGNLIYFENSDGYWVKREYDANGNLIYREDSDGQILVDNR